MGPYEGSSDRLRSVKKISPVGESRQGISYFMESYQLPVISYQL